MPTYDYYCEANGRTVEVAHPLGQKPRCWGELCYYARLPLGDTDPAAAVRVAIRRPPGMAVAKFNSELRNIGFTKLEKRDHGVYENVTATDKESRYMRRGDDSTVPDLRGKVGD